MYHSIFMLFSKSLLDDYAVNRPKHGILCSPGGALKFTLLFKVIFDTGKLCRQLGRAAGSATATFLNGRNRDMRKTKTTYNGTPVAPHKGRAKNSWEIFADFGSHYRDNRQKPQHGRRKSTTGNKNHTRAITSAIAIKIATKQMKESMQLEYAAIRYMNT